MPAAVLAQQRGEQAGKPTNRRHRRAGVQSPDGRAGKKANGSAKTHDAEPITVWPAEFTHSKTDRPNTKPVRLAIPGRSKALPAATPTRTRAPFRSSTCGTRWSIRGRSRAACMATRPPLRPERSGVTTYWKRASSTWCWPPAGCPLLGRGRRCVGHMERNRDRMRYAEFRAAGLCVGSGMVESGCKSMIRSRLKQSG